MPAVPRQPILITGLGVLILSCMDAAMKSVAAVYPLAEVVGLRYAVGTIVSCVVFSLARERMPGSAALKRNLLRSVVVLLTAGCFFTAIARLPLAEAISLTFLAPFFTAALGYAVLGEPVTSRLKLGIVFGLLGVCVIGTGQGGDAGLAFDLVGIGAALSCAFFYALSNVLVRRSSGSDSSITIVLLSNVFAFGLASPAMITTWQPPTTAHLMVFSLAGLLGAAGHLCLAWSYMRAPAGILGVMEYTAFIWASLLGFVIFGEVPSRFTVLGASLITGGCILSTWRRTSRAAEPAP